MVAKESTMRYNVFYLASFAVILLVFYWVPSGYIEALTAQASSWALAVLGHAASWEQLGGQTTLTLIGQHAVTVSIIRECTALNVFGVMAGLILPLRASWVKRLTGIAISGVLLFSLNIPRIALTVYLTAYDTWPFTLMAARSLETYHYPISFGSFLQENFRSVAARISTRSDELCNPIWGPSHDFPFISYCF